jgi:outer membrane lipoprotein-sorting protein
VGTKEKGEYKMKKFFTISLLGFCLLSFLTVSGFGQNVQSILDKMIDVVGGRKTLEGIEDITLTGSMEIVQMGMSGTISFFYKEPNMLRQDVDLPDLGVVFTTASDGEAAWMINPQTGMVEDLTGNSQVEMDNEALNFGFSWLIRPEKYGLSYTDKGKETIDGKEYIVLEQSAPGGQTTTFYIDPETYLTHKTKTMATSPMGFTVLEETITEDYRKVDGIMFAHTVIIYQDGEEFGSVAVEGVKFNSGLEDSLFKK